MPSITNTGPTGYVLPNGTPLPARTTVEASAEDLNVFRKHPVIAALIKSGELTTSTKAGTPIPDPGGKVVDPLS